MPGLKRHTRRGVAASELALVMPFLAFILMAALDFARLYYTYLTITSCARNGALYGCLSPSNSTNTSGIQSAALADASSLNPALPSSNITSSTGTDANGNPTVQVTVQYSYYPLIKFPVFGSMGYQYGTDSSGTPYVPLSRTVEMRVVQNTPN
jgi:Flp pilus assembly protein TadG